MLLIAKAKQLLEKEEKLIAWEKQLQAKQEALVWRERCLDVDISSKGLDAIEVGKNVLQSSTSSIAAVKINPEAKLSLHERIAAKGAVLPQLSMPSSSPYVVNGKPLFTTVRAIRQSTPPIRSILGMPSRNASPSTRPQSVATLLRARAVNTPPSSDTVNRNLLTVSTGSVWLPSLPTHSPVALTGGWHRVNDTTQMNLNPTAPIGVQPLVQQQRTVVEIRQPYSMSPAVGVGGSIPGGVHLVNSSRSTTGGGVISRHRLPGLPVNTSRLVPSRSSGVPPATITLGPRPMPIVSSLEGSIHFSNGLIASPSIYLQSSSTNPINNMHTTDACSVVGTSDDLRYPRWQQSQAMKLQSSGTVIGERQVNPSPVAGIVEPLTVYPPRSFVGGWSAAVEAVKNKNNTPMISITDAKSPINRSCNVTEDIGTNVIPRSVRERLELVTDSEPEDEAMDNDEDVAENTINFPTEAVKTYDKLTEKLIKITEEVVVNNASEKGCADRGIKSADTGGVVQFDRANEEIKYGGDFLRLRPEDTGTTYPNGKTFTQWLIERTKQVCQGEARVGASLPMLPSGVSPVSIQLPRTLSVPQLKNSHDVACPLKICGFVAEADDKWKALKVDSPVVKFDGCVAKIEDMEKVKTVDSLIPQSPSFIKINKEDDDSDQQRNDDDGDQVVRYLPTQSPAVGPLNVSGQVQDVDAVSEQNREDPAQSVAASDEVQQPGNIELVSIEPALNIEPVSIEPALNIEPVSIEPALNIESVSIEPALNIEPVFARYSEPSDTELLENDLKCSDETTDSVTEERANRSTKTLDPTPHGASLEYSHHLNVDLLPVVCLKKLDSSEIREMCLNERNGYSVSGIVDTSRASEQCPMGHLAISPVVVDSAAQNSDVVAGSRKRRLSCQDDDSSNKKINNLM